MNEPPRSLLLFGSNWPEPASSAAGTRTLQLLETFRAHDWKITVASAAKRRPHSALLPDEIRQESISINCSSVDALIQDLSPDLVCFDRFMLEEQFGWRVRAACPSAKCMVDTIDLHSLRDMRRKALHAKREPELKDWFSDLALRELSSLLRSDLNLLISDAEAQILTKQLKLPASLFHVTPFLSDADQQEAWRSSPAFSDRKSFVSIGNFRHPPNADAVRFLAEQIWPKIRKRCPDTELHIYGADLSPSLQQLHSPSTGFHLMGRAVDAVDTLAGYRVCLAPLRFGAGLKGKLYDAMLAGTPSVTTAIGAEGMQGDFPWPGEVCDAIDSLVAAASALVEDESLWRERQERIPALLQGRFHAESHRTALMERVNQLLEEAETASIDQLYGAMLRMHQHRSTEFMSRWIELKNQSKSS